MKKKRTDRSLKKFPVQIPKIEEHKTERSATADLMHFIREILEQKNIDLWVDIETSAQDERFPDLVIYKSRNSKEVLCVIEAKLPHFDVFDREGLKIPAFNKASARNAPYFATTNFKTLIWWDAKACKQGKTETEQIIDIIELSRIEDINLIEQSYYKQSIFKGLEYFLQTLYQVYSGKQVPPQVPIDETLIFALQTTVYRLSRYYNSIIYDKCCKDNDFCEKVRDWFNQQGLNFLGSKEDFEMISRQTAYLLVLKILFYFILQRQRPNELPRLESPQWFMKGGQVQRYLQIYFDEALKLKYTSIYTTDFVDTLAFPDNGQIVEEIKHLVDKLERFRLSEIHYEILGQVFQKIIPIDERHYLGQYFTSPDIVDLILGFSIKSADDKILDPACGAGTFLVRAYHYKKLMNRTLTHQELLHTLWGVEIAKFPAILSIINLAINDLSSSENHPYILNEDFFNLISTSTGLELPEKWRNMKIKTIDGKEKGVTYPRWFDCIVGNPPYTRQEEIQEISAVDEYKRKVIQMALENAGIATFSERAGIHAYFFIHGTKFLKDGGRFGFIVNNSWLNSDWGVDLQRFFLQHYKIVAIIDSIVERWFEQAGVNTCIIILEKCDGENKKQEREQNIVRFTLLKNPLKEFIPPSQHMWEKEVQRIDAVRKLVDTILYHKDFYEDSSIRIHPIIQRELTNFTKWGPFLRADKFFFKIMEHRKLVPLKDVVNYSYGIKTGNVKFFYLDDEKIKYYKIEKRFTRPIITTSKKINKIDIKPDKKVFYCHLPVNKIRNTGALNYILWGEKKGMNKGRTVQAHKPFWYSIKGEEIDILLLQFWDKKFLTPIAQIPMFASNNFFYAKVKGRDSLTIQIIKAQLNSILYFLQLELFGRIQGDGVLNTYGPDFDVIKIIEPGFLKKRANKILSAFSKMREREIHSIFEELGLPKPDKEYSNIDPEQIELKNVRQDRLTLDLEIFSAMRLKKEDLLACYKLMATLVKWRLKKAISITKGNPHDAPNIDLIVKSIIEKIQEEA